MLIAHCVALDIQLAWVSLRSGGCQACEEADSGSGRKTRANPVSVKQEVSFVPL
jgi:uncharacterized protein YecT (DUF1311 family)